MDGNFLAYEKKSQPLPVLHGFPLRTVFLGIPGSQGEMVVRNQGGMENLEQIPETRLALPA